MPPRLLMFAGSSRTESLNKKLATNAASLAQAAGAEVTLIDLRDFPMPLYDGDLEDAQGMPEAAQRLRQLMIGHDGMLIASPENNASVSALLKNAIDWVSRPFDRQPGTVPYRGKVTALVAASTGAFAGVRGLPHLRQILSQLGAIVLPEQYHQPSAHTAFNAAGGLQDPLHRAGLEAVVKRLVEVSARLATARETAAS